jgi:hypothetical protein
MNRLFRFVKNLFTFPLPSEIPSSCSEMTLHDALRLCYGEETGAPINPRTRRPSFQASKKNCWDEFNHSPRGIACEGSVADHLSPLPLAGVWTGFDRFDDAEWTANSGNGSEIEISEGRDIARHEFSNPYRATNRVAFFLPVNRRIRDRM